MRGFTRDGGPPVRLTVDDEVFSAAAPAVRSTIHRVIVEALTNIRRHAPTAGEVEVTVGFGDEGTVVLTVTSDGAEHGAAHGGHRRGGLGLAALTERVEALGGRLTAAAEGPGVWRVCVELPGAR